MHVPLQIRASDYSFGISNRSYAIQLKKLKECSIFRFPFPRRYVINDERTGKRFRQIEHIRGYLLHSYFTCSTYNILSVIPALSVLLVCGLSARRVTDVQLATIFIYDVSAGLQQELHDGWPQELYTLSDDMSSTSAFSVVRSLV
jgi:hypothetical protein